jgi:hypothetical protein
VSQDPAFESTKVFKHVLRFLKRTGRVAVRGCGLKKWVAVADRVVVAGWQCVGWTGEVIAVILSGEKCKIGTLLTEIHSALDFFFFFSFLDFTWRWLVWQWQCLKKTCDSG